ncbi:MAG: putative iron-regulated protein [Gammaproteobacteria bacterium]|jgi:uncharacterized iron-regulated protein
MRPKVSPQDELGISQKKPRSCFTRRQLGHARVALVAAQLLLIAGCAPPLAPAQHPLLNTMVHAESGAPFASAQLLPTMDKAGVIYLGEKHDNTAHHQQQLWVLSELIRLGHRPLLGLEIFAASETGTLMEFINAVKSTKTADPAERRLREAMGIRSAEDEHWLRYAPLLQLARTHKLTAFGIDLPTALRRRVSRVGIDGLSAVERSAVPDTGSVNPGYKKLMLARLKTAHCGHGADAYLERLFQNWEIRNETMARTITTAAAARGSSPVVVILGGGHVSNGEGVIPRVARHLPDTQQLIVSFVELDEAHLESTAYLADQHASKPNAALGKELLWFTARHGLTMDEACKMFRHVKPAAAPKSG